MDLEVLLMISKVAGITAIALIAGTLFSVLFSNPDKKQHEAG